LVVKAYAHNKSIIIFGVNLRSVLPTDAAHKSGAIEGGLRT
jgi:hypothetical protein